MSQPGRGTGRLTSIGPYTLLDRVGSGGMGVVYRALDRRSGTVVAFKLLHDHVASDPGAVERFRREAHVASLLRSSYRVQTLDFGSDDGRYYLVSEYVEGRSLADILKEGRPEPLAAIAIVSQAALALDEAHSREITHRDIKPDNILVTEDGSVKLADFGIASLPYLGGLTMTGAYIGTVAYSAPEQHQGKADIRSDIYSLGVVLYEMLAGRRPFEAENATRVMRMHEDDAPPLGPLGGQPPELVAVVTKCLEKDPAARYQKPSDLLAALNGARQFVAGTGPVDSWMEAAVAGLGATGVYASPVPPPPDIPSPGVPATSLDAPAPAAVSVAAQPELLAVEISETRVDSVPPPAASASGGSKLPGRPILIAAGALAVLLIASLGAFFALSSGDGDDDPRESNPGGTGETTATPARQSPTSAQTPAPASTASPSSAPSTSAVPSGVATFEVIPGTQPVATQPPFVATATPRPPTPTTAPPTATATTPVQATYGSPTFATVLTQSGLPPAAGVPSGGTISGTCPTNLVAYVQHTNVPVGTQLTGSWQFQAGDQQSNPTFATNSASGWTNYQFSNQSGLPAGTYTFRLRSGLTQVTSGTVTIAC